MNGTVICRKLLWMIMFNSETAAHTGLGLSVAWVTKAFTTDTTQEFILDGYIGFLSELQKRNVMIIIIHYLDTSLYWAGIDIAVL